MTKGGPRRAARETNQVIVRGALLRRLPRRLSGRGQLVLPPVPSLAEHFAGLAAEAFGALGRPFSDAETEHLGGTLKTQLAATYKASPYSRVIVDYQTDPPPKTSLSYSVRGVSSTLENEYASWVQLRTPPYFGTHPDAKIVESARSLGAPAEVPVLDVGAGTGRNTLPLAREGFPTDAVEPAPALAAILRTEVEKEALPVRVFEANALASELPVPAGHYRLVCLAEVIASHIRSASEIRRLGEVAARSLVSGGLFVFNAFLAKDGYRPDALARELAEVFWCNLFTRAELTAAFDGLPFEFVSDESTHDYEAEHLPAEAWPPTGWFVEWARGLNLFDLAGGRAPSELRWLVYRRH